MITRVKVVLNMNHLSVPQKINKAQMVMANITANPASFPSATPIVTELGSAINALQAAYMDAADGAHSKIALMHDRENDLMDVMQEVALFVGKLTKADAGIVHLAGLELKHVAHREQPDFMAARGPEPGTVQLHSKVHKGMFYKWQYCADPVSTSGWVNALAGHVSRVLLTGIPAGFYWFRVVHIDDMGSEHAGEPMRLAVS